MKVTQADIDQYIGGLQKTRGISISQTFQEIVEIEQNFPQRFYVYD